MGCCVSTQLTKQEKKLDSEISQHMTDNENLDKKMVKILLLGAGSSGKSTILRQMKHLYVETQGLSQESLKMYAKIIYYNLIIVIHTLIIIRESLNIQVKNNKSLESQNKLKLLLKNNLFKTKDEFINDRNINYLLIESYKNDNSLKLVGYKYIIECNKHPSLIDNYKYMLDAFDDITSEKYIPTFKDIINCRTTTSGIVEEMFWAIYNNKSYCYTMIDVGGQRNERSKWIACFDKVSTILFVISLNGFDQVLYEDHTTNKLEEALILFEQTLNLKALRNIPFILFLNKYDLFKDKLNVNKIEFSCLYKEEKYNGSSLVETEVLNWLTKLLQRINKLRTMYETKESTRRKLGLNIHITNATDTQIIENTFSNVQSNIAKKRFETLELY